MSERNALAKEQFITIIPKWLNEEKARFDQVQDSVADLNVAVTVSTMHRVNVIVNKESLDSVLFITSIGFSPDDQNTFSHLKEDARRKFLRAIKRDLINIGVAFATPPNEMNVQSIQMSKTVYFDGLTKNSFFETLLTVSRALMAVQLSYETYLSKTRDSV